MLSRLMLVHFNINANQRKAGAFAKEISYIVVRSKNYISLTLHRDFRVMLIFKIEKILKTRNNEHFPFEMSDSPSIWPFHFWDISIQIRWDPASVLIWNLSNGCKNYIKVKKTGALLFSLFEQVFKNQVSDFVFAMSAVRSKIFSQGFTQDLTRIVVSASVKKPCLQRRYFTMST